MTLDNYNCRHRVPGWSCGNGPGPGTGFRFWRDSGMEKKPDRLVVFALTFNL